MSQFAARLLAVIVFLVQMSGCKTAQVDSSLLPGEKVLKRQQLVIHSDFHVPVRHRLIDELVARQSDIAETLRLPVSDEPINIYLFEDSEKFQTFMQKLHPDFADRRAFFVKNDTQLRIFAHWGPRVGEDLRHEVTHGYLHSVVPNMGLWMDEGFAEFFEVSRGKGGINSQHIYNLSNRYRHSEWLPNLKRLESIRSPSDLTQADYAESWLWVHYLLEKNDATRKFLQDHLARLRLSGSDEPISEQIKTLLPDAEVELVNHLRKLAELEEIR